MNTWIVEGSRRRKKWKMETETFEQERRKTLMESRIRRSCRKNIKNFMIKTKKNQKKILTGGKKTRKKVIKILVS